MPNRYKLLRFSNDVAAVPTIAKVRDGTIRTYFSGSQGVSYNEPPDYTAPTDWPRAAYTVFRRPICFRLITDQYNPGGGGTTGSSVTKTFNSKNLEAQGNVDVEYCSCDTDVTFAGPSGPVTTAISNVTLSYMNDLFAASVGDPSIFTSVTVETGGGCSCSGGGGGSDVNLSYRQLADVVDMPANSTRFVTDTMPTTQYLSGVSVHADDVPSGADDYAFVGGKVLNVWLFGSNDAESEYNAATIAASDLGVRLIGAYPKFRQYKTILAVNSLGNASSTLKTKLSAIAGVFGSYGFEYAVWDSTDDMTDAISAFFF